MMPCSHWFDHMFKMVYSPQGNLTEVSWVVRGRWSTAMVGGTLDSGAIMCTREREHCTVGMETYTVDTFTSTRDTEKETRCVFVCLPLFLCTCLYVCLCICLFFYAPVCMCACVSTCVQDSCNNRSTQWRKKSFLGLSPCGCLYPATI